MKIERLALGRVKAEGRRKNEEIYLIDETFEHRRLDRPLDMSWKLENMSRCSCLAHLEGLNFHRLLRSANVTTAVWPIMLRLDIPSQMLNMGSLTFGNSAWAIYAIPHLPNPR
jgi:hypothetical protein